MMAIQTKHDKNVDEDDVGGAAERRGGLSRGLSTGQAE